MRTMDVQPMGRRHCVFIMGLIGTGITMTRHLFVAHCRPRTGDRVLTLVSLATIRLRSRLPGTAILGDTTSPWRRPPRAWPAAATCHLRRKLAHAELWATRLLPPTTVHIKGDMKIVLTTGPNFLTVIKGVMRSAESNEPCTTRMVSAPGLLIGRGIGAVAPRVPRAALCPRLADLLLLFLMR